MAIQSLHVGNSGLEVRKLQLQLKQLGFDPGGVDGIFGRATDSALRRFQRKEGIVSDGIAGQETLERLNQKAPIEMPLEQSSVEEQSTPEITQQILEVSAVEDKRILLKRLGNTRIYALQTHNPWKQPFDALVIPANPSVALGGRLASSFLSYLSSKAAEVLEAQTQRMKREQYVDGIDPDNVLVVPLQQESQLSKDTSQSIIIATVEDSERKINNKNVTRATYAVLRAASNQALSRLVTPLLGTGGYGLSVSSVATSILQTIVNRSADFQQITEITLVHPEQQAIEAIIKAAEVVFRDPDFLAQTPLNDLPTGQDLLNIKTEVDALAEVLLMRSLEPPLVVGILGGWGSGKSHIMHLMQERMTEIRSLPIDGSKAWVCRDDNLNDSSRSLPDDSLPYIGHVYQITFDAWTYAKSNLWSSLMETIFFELNRQLTLEQQLSKAGVLPCQGGKIWKVLNAMSDEERQTLLHLNLNDTQRKKLETIPTGQALEGELLSALIDIRNKQKEELKQNEIKLQKEQNSLEERKKTLVQEAVRQIQTETALKPIEARLYALMGDVFEEFKQQLSGNIEDGNSSQLNPADIEWLRSQIEQLKSTRLITWSSIAQWAMKNWRGIIASALFVALTLITPIILLQAKAGLIPSLVAAVVPLMPAIIAVQSVLKTLRKWHESIEKSVDEYQSRIKELEEQKIQEKLNDPEIKQAEEKIKHLELQVEQQRQLVVTANEMSVADFVNAQLEKGLYGKRLGLMQQVKSDLASLSQQLCLPPNYCGERYSEKVDRLKNLFPRGPARVILFIDDLDRCPPDRVVEVLEAVQLLVKHPLFVVVLAIDERYIARALEKVYAGVLSRKGRPSGIDYIEKIIQIPYRVRLISRSALQGYLKAQMQIDTVQIQDISQETEPYPAPGVDLFPSDERPRERAVVQGDQVKESDDSTPEDGVEALPPQVIKFTQEEFHILLEACEQVDLSPRTLKRLINVYKLFKIVWFRSGKSQSIQTDLNVQKAIIALLVLSGRYPSLMRSVFEDLEIEFEEKRTSKRELSTFFPEKPNLNTDTYLCREWNRLLHDVKHLKLNSLTLQHLDEETFNMVRSFCFVGDIGYDPNDFKPAEIPTEQPDRASR